MNNAAGAMMHVTLRKFGNKVCIAYELRVPLSSRINKLADKVKSLWCIRYKFSVSTSGQDILRMKLLFALAYRPWNRVLGILCNPETYFRHFFIRNKHEAASLSGNKYTTIRRNKIENFSFIVYFISDSDFYKLE